MPSVKRQAADDKIERALEALTKSITGRIGKGNQLETVIPGLALW
jgi:hypothetical protein